MSKSEEDIKIKNFSFPVTIYGQLEKYNEVLSKARCRIFYKYENRNGTYITDEFAEKLISTLPYTPTKGIYDEEKEDYTDHGEERDLGRIYGIVPETLNFSWENHKDEDGVTRTYACCDVLLFTALYDEAKDIVNKSQSMELYAPSLKGNWKFINGRKFFVFEEGCFLGLQVLGDDVTPCFEGAAFYTYYNSIYELLNKIKNYEQEVLTEEGGEKKVSLLNYKVSDSQKFDALWNLLNTEYNEENNWTITYSICDIYDNYAVVKNYPENKFERVYYKKDDGTDTVEIVSKEVCYIMDVTEKEKTILDNIYNINNHTYENIEEKLGDYDLLKEKKEEYERKIEENEQTISTLNTEKQNAEENYALAQNSIEALTSENSELKNYKLENERKNKMAVITKYAQKLDEEVIKEYEEKVDEYDIINLEKDLAFSLVNSNDSIFSKDEHYTPINLEPTGLEAILAKYNK